MSTMELLEKFPVEYSGKIISMTYGGFASFVDINKIQIKTRNELLFCDRIITRSMPRRAYYICTEDRVVLKLIK